MIYLVWFSDMNPAVQKSTIIALLVAAIGPPLSDSGDGYRGGRQHCGGNKQAGAAHQGTIVCVGVLSKAMAFLAANPIVFVVAAVVALIAILVHLWKTNEDFRNAIIIAWNK